MIEEEEEGESEKSDAMWSILLLNSHLEGLHNYYEQRK